MKTGQAPDALDGFSCPAMSPSDRPRIGRGEYHETHCAKNGTTWRDWAGKRRGQERTDVGAGE